MSAAPSEIVQIAARPGASVSRAWLRALELTAPIARQRERVLPAVVDELGHRLGDKPALLCVRSGGVDVGVEGLSEGTRDQLYLSLRLATLLRYAKAREPLPLVLDDVLVHSDDERAAAALGVLAEVARSMQVLFFTHHARLVELARTTVPSDPSPCIKSLPSSPNMVSRSAPPAMTSLPKRPVAVVFE